MIQFNDLKLQYEKIKDEINAVIDRVLGSGWYILGEEVEKFEGEFAQYCGAKYAVGVGSGTEALHLALVALGIGAGDEVITVPNTAVATCSAISFARATPVFVDIDSKTYLMNPELLEQAITPRTKAIIPVHLYGQLCDMEQIMKVARLHKIPVIEDASQAHGAVYWNTRENTNDKRQKSGENTGGKRAGTFGVMGCFSLYPTKNLGAFGDAGIIVTADEELYKKLRLLRNYGQTTRYYHIIEGFNSRLDELQAACLRVKLRYLEQWNERRREIAGMYKSLIKNPVVTLPCEAPESTYPEAERHARENLALPLHPYLKEEEITEICEAVNTFKP